jgi:hypothetical protein
MVTQATDCSTAQCPPNTKTSDSTASHFNSLEDTPSRLGRGPRVSTGNRPERGPRARLSFRTLFAERDRMAATGNRPNYHQKLNLRSPDRFGSVANTLHRELTRWRRHFSPASALAGLLSCLLLVSSAMAVSPAHGQSHHADRGPASHQCVLCLMAHSQIIAADTPASPTRPIDRFADPAPQSELAIQTADDHRLLPGRAPPSFIFLPIR